MKRALNIIILAAATMALAASLTEMSDLIFKVKESKKRSAESDEIYKKMKAAEDKYWSAVTRCREQYGKDESKWPDEEKTAINNAWSEFLAVTDEFSMILKNRIQ